MSQHSGEIAGGQRFEFGKNWQSFLKVVDEDRITEAERSLKKMLDVEDLNGKSFLDIGSGSGLFSLAARRLGACVDSFDYDPQSVACTAELKRRHFPDDPKWSIQEGSVLDGEFIRSLSKFDIVYSWGVLHHTGDMWQALDNASIPLKEGGRLFVAIYNDQGGKSRRWRTVKRFYCSSLLGKVLVIGFFVPYFFLRFVAVDVLQGRNPLDRYMQYKSSRGMSVLRDWFDWLGGYPFEVAKPEQIFEYYRKKGYSLERLKTWGGGKGCNEYVFAKK